MSTQSLIVENTKTRLGWFTLSVSRGRNIERVRRDRVVALDRFAHLRAAVAALTAEDVAVGHSLCGRTSGAAPGRRPARRN